MKNRNTSMLEGPLFKNIVSYTIPIILTGILQLLFNAADLIIVGQYRGSIYIAAVGATGSLTGLIINLFLGLSVGTGVTVAHAYGQNDPEAIHRTVHTAIPLAIIIGIFLSIIGITFSETFLKLMKTPIDVLPLSTTYMKINFGGMVFSLLYNFCASILRALGDSKRPLIFLTISGIINVILNIIFVTLFNMDVDGVALATVISQAVSAVLVVLALMHRNDASKLVLSKIKIYKAQLFKILRLGLPAGLQSSLFAISNVIIQSSINSFGDIVMSGNAAAANIEGFLYTTMNSFYQTTVNFTGQNVGAKQPKRVLKIFRICLLSVSVTGLILGFSLFLFSKPLLSIYITDSAEAILYGIIRNTIVGIPYLLCGLMEVSTGVLRGMGVSIIPMIISILGICGIRLTWIYTIFQIDTFHTTECLYLSYPISWALTFLVQTIAFIIVYKRWVKKLNVETSFSA